MAKQKMTPSEALVETLVAEGGDRCVRYCRLSLHGCLGPFPCGRHPFHSRGPRTGGGPCGRWSGPHHRQAPVLHRPERPRCRQLRIGHGGGLLGPQPGGGPDPGDGGPWGSARAAFRNWTRCPCSNVRPSTRCVSTSPSAWPNWPGARFTWPRTSTDPPSSTSRGIFSTASVKTKSTRPRASAAVPAPRPTSTRRRG